MSHNGRPPRAGDYPRITFHVQERTFDRLLKESSLSDLKKAVGTKLGLKSGSVIQLAQLRYGQSIDLEDEDDFDAFHSLAHEQRHVEVQVSIADNPIAEEAAPVLEERLRKKHKHKHEAQATPEREVEQRVENRGSLGKKRKVAFTEPSAEIDAPVRSPKEHQRKKRKDDSDGVVTVARFDRGSSEAFKNKKSSSSHDSGEDPKQKKKRKRKSAIDLEADDSVQSSTPSKHQSLSSDSETSQVESKALPGTSGGQLLSIPEYSTFNEQEGPVAIDVSPARSKKKGAAPRAAVSSTPKKRASRSKSNPTADSIVDDDAASQSPDSAQKDKNLVRTVRNKDENDVLDYSKGETKNRKRSSTANANKTKTRSNIENGQIKDTSVDTSGSSLDNAPAGDRVEMNDKAKVPQAGAKKGAGSLKTICLVCNRTPEHELVDCPVVKEGPTSIQKRIRALTRRKIPDNEKLPLISELQKLKAEQKESEKRKTREAKNVGIKLRSQSEPSPPTDEGTKDVGGHTNGVGGVSKESRSVNQTASSSGRSSATPLLEALSLDTGTHLISGTKWTDDNRPITLPDIGDVSALDLDALMKGPESSFLSINDMPSSDDDSDEAEEMSGEPDPDETERLSFAKLMQDDSSDSGASDNQGDEPDGESEKHVESLKHTQSPETDNSSDPKHNEDSDASGDSTSDINRDDAGTIHAVCDADEITRLSSGQVDDMASPNSTNTSEEQQSMNDARGDLLGGMSIHEESPRPFEGRVESSSGGVASSGRKPAKTARKTNGISLSQVSKELEESAARNPKASARLKNKLAPNTSNRSAKKMAVGIASAPRSMSVDNWTALKEESSSHPDDDGSTLVDELLPSSPVVTRSQTHRDKKSSNGAASKDEISEPSTSQLSLSYSQKSRSQDPIEDVESNSEREAKDIDSHKRRRKARYRPLSKIPSASIHKDLQIPRLTPSTPREKAAELYGNRGRRENEIEDESESSSTSGSETEKTFHSHIPKKRVAGIS